MYRTILKILVFDILDGVEILSYCGGQWIKSVSILGVFDEVQVSINATVSIVSKISIPRWNLALPSRVEIAFNRFD